MRKENSQLGLAEVGMLYIGIDLRTSAAANYPTEIAKALNIQGLYNELLTGIGPVTSALPMRRSTD